MNSMIDISASHPVTERCPRAACSKPARREPMPIGEKLCAVLVAFTAVYLCLEVLGAFLSGAIQQAVR